MSARDVIKAVMAEASKDTAAVPMPGFAWGLGRREASAQSGPTRIDWIPVRGRFQGPQKSSANPRPLQNRWVRWDVRCWGATEDEAEQLLEFLVRALHLTLTAGGYAVEDEIWLEEGAVHVGDAVVVGVLLGIPVRDRPQPTVRPTTLTTDGTIP